MFRLDKHNRNLRRIIVHVETDDSVVKEHLDSAQKDYDELCAFIKRDIARFNKEHP